MPRFSANISMLFKELEFPERFEAAAQAGFKAVEIQFPYAWDKGQLARIAQHVGVEAVCLPVFVNSGMPSARRSSTLRSSVAGR